jgi:hypothetical protein
VTTAEPGSPRKQKHSKLFFQAILPSYSSKLFFQAILPSYSSKMTSISLDFTDTYYKNNSSPSNLYWCDVTKYAGWTLKHETCALCKINIQKKCIPQELNTCGHIYCAKCIHQYYTIEHNITCNKCNSYINMMEDPKINMMEDPKINMMKDPKINIIYSTFPLAPIPQSSIARPFWTPPLPPDHYDSEEDEKCPHCHSSCCNGTCVDGDYEDEYEYYDGTSGALSCGCIDVCRNNCSSWGT